MKGFWQEKVWEIYGSGAGRRRSACLVPMFILSNCLLGWCHPDGLDSGGLTIHTPPKWEDSAAWSLYLFRFKIGLWNF